jgi:heptaprenyl diphosphate synthase
MDESPLRHGVPTVNAQFGTAHALLAGDYLLGHALRIGAELGSAEGALAASAFIRMCEGQTGEMARRFDSGRDEDDYFATVRGKTGALFDVAFRMGALAAGLGDRTTGALGAFGMRLGVSFQVLDDVLDFTASAEELGKPVGQDVAEGVYTLPLIRALDGRPELTALLNGGDRAAGAELAVRAVRDAGTVPAALDIARAYAEQAIAGLAEAGDDVRPEALAVLAGLARTLTD